MALQIDFRRMNKVRTPLVGIEGKLVKVKGNVKLSVTLRDKDRKRTLRHSFMVAKISAPSKAIFDKPLLNELRVALSP